MTHRTEGEPPTSKTQRTVTAAFGVFFVLLALGMVLSVEGSVFPGTVLAAMAIGLLGVEACISAARGKRSWLDRIGPLP